MGRVRRHGDLRARVLRRHRRKLLAEAGVHEMQEMEEVEMVGSSRRSRPREQPAEDARAVATGAGAAGVSGDRPLHVDEQSILRAEGEANLTEISALMQHVNQSSYMSACSFFISPHTYIPHPLFISTSTIFIFDLYKLITFYCVYAFCFFLMILLIMMKQCSAPPALLRTSANHPWAVSDHQGRGRALDPSGSKLKCMPGPLVKIDLNLPNPLRNLYK